MPRLFIALPLDESVTDNLARVGTAANVRGARWVPPESMHLTLAFLGDVEERRLSELEDALVEATAEVREPLQLRVQGLGAFPSEEAARTLWAGLDGDVPRLIELQKRLAQELRRSGFDFDQRRFRPHITLARLRQTQPMPERLPRLQAFGELVADEVQIIESHLHPGGARYVVRSDVPLGSE